MMLWEDFQVNPTLTEQVRHIRLTQMEIYHRSQSPTRQDMNIRMNQKEMLTALLLSQGTP